MFFFYHLSVGCSFALFGMCVSSEVVVHGVAHVNQIFERNSYYAKANKYWLDFNWAGNRMKNHSKLEYIHNIWFIPIIEIVFHKLGLFKNQDNFYKQNGIRVSYIQQTHEYTATICVQTWLDACAIAMTKRCANYCYQSSISQCKCLKCKVWKCLLYAYLCPGTGLFS